MLSFRHQITGVYTIHQEVVNNANSVIPVLVLINWGDHLQCLTSGIIRAMGYQKQGSIVCLSGFWLVAVPLTYLLAIKLEYGIRGAWLGLGSGLAIAGCSYLYIIYSTNWVQLSKDILDRILRDKMQTTGNNFFFIL